MKKALLPLFGAILVLTILFTGVIVRDAYVPPWSEKENSPVWSAYSTTLGKGLRATFGALLDPLRGSVLLGANSKSAEGTGTLVAGVDASDAVNTGEGVSFPPELYFYRTLLSESQQAVYNQVYANTVAVNGEYFTLVKSLDEEALIQVVNAVLNDHPGLFWLDTSYSYGYLSSGNVVSLCLSFNRTAADLSNSRAAFERVVGDIVAKASALPGDAAKEKYVHDYLMDYVSYDQTASVNQSAYSALVSGRSVCAGYSRAFQHVLMQLGIPCYYCEGVVDGGNHAWNIVKLSDGYYNVDTSWDDASGAAFGTYYYDYYNVTDALFDRDHVRRGMSEQLPACTATGYAVKPQAGSGGSAAQDAGESGGQRTLSELGFDQSDVITTLKRYDRYCEKQLTRRGVGTYTLTMVLEDTALLNEVYAHTENEDYIAGYVRGAAENLSLTDCRISLKLSGEALSGGYILLTQTVTLSGGTASAPAAPTPSPTPTGAPTPAFAPAATPEPTAEPVTEPTPAPESTEAPGAVWPGGEGTEEGPGPHQPGEQGLPDGFAPAA